MPRRSPLIGAGLATGSALLLSACGTPVLHITPPTVTNALVVTCSRLVDRLPNRLQDLDSRLVAPRGPLVHAWGSRPVILRCGVPTPAGYSPTSSSVAVVNGVSWFQQVEPTRVVWTAVRTTANVELTVPTSYAVQGGFLVDISAAITASIR